MKCPNCGGELKANLTYCEFCNSQISSTMKKEQEQMNKAGCPKCGSSNITFSRETLGEVKGKKGSEIVRATVGVCHDCGYTWKTAMEEKKRKTWLWVLGWVFIFPLPLTILLLKKKNMKSSLKYGIIAAAWIVYGIMIATAGNDTPESEEPKMNVEATINVEETKTSKTKDKKEESTPTPKTDGKKEESTPTPEIDDKKEESTPTPKGKTEQEDIKKKIEDAVINPKLKEFLDSYEQFMDEYCEFMEKYDASDLKQLAKYTELLKKYYDFAEKADAYDTDIMTDAESAYYLEVMGRVMLKLSKTVH